MLLVIWLSLLSYVGVSVLWFDLGQRRVPNKLLLVAFGLQVLWLAGFSFLKPELSVAWQPVIMTHWLPALATAAVALIVLFPLWRFRAMGAGDVKFAAVLGFCMGPLGLLQAFLIGSMLAGVHAVLYLLQQQAPWLLGRWGARAVPRSTPYAAYMALGVLFGVAWQVFNGQPWLQRLVHEG